jgi:alpha-D-xyloside xylohydrolase
VFQLESKDRGALFVSPQGQRLRVIFVSPSIARISYTEGRDFSEGPSRIVIAQDAFQNVALREDDECYLFTTPVLAVELNKRTGALNYSDSAGKLLFREPERGGKCLTPKPVYRNVFNRNTEAAFDLNIDGARAVATPAQTVLDREAFEARLEFVFSEGEALFGLGSHEEGYGNLRGRSRELYQQNMKAVIPYFVSTRGYGVLLDCCSLMTFHDDALGSYWWADVVEQLDFYVIQGENFDEVTRGYYHLTGSAPMLPKWALGFLQSKERYVNAHELIDVVSEYRRRRVPLDGIVLDWKSWPNGAGWGQKSFDPARFPNPSAMTDALHAIGARLMVSIWPIMTGGCANQRELLDRGMMLGNQSTYNAFLPEARARYWQQAKAGLFDHGVDAWWCDCTEPFEADWAGAVKPEPFRRLAINTEQSKLYLDAADINAYSLLHSQGIYEGQRSANAAKRVLNLTRSSYAGQHRYATVTWNGDVCATWETLRRSIPEGLNFCAAGEPYWTVDIGGFFVNYDPRLWFWRGDYAEGCRGLTGMNAMEPDRNDDGCKDLGYWELYTRWLQYAAFLPMCRSHGTDAAREIWRFGEEGTPFYDAIAAFILLRYRLIPYLYTLMAAVTRSAVMMMRALALQFPEDPATYSILDQYMLGPALLVCPVTTPMYYRAGSVPIAASSKTRSVYLPDGCRWFDFWTNATICGGQTIVAEAPLDKIPLYVRAGSIVPMTDAMQFVDEVPDAPYEIRVYRGTDSEFVLYEDARDGYQYEEGEFALIRLTWNEARRELSIAERQGSFSSMVKGRECRIVFISGQGVEVHPLRYTGNAVRLRAAENRNGANA